MDKELVDEKEINLIELCYYVLRRWRLILFSILITGVLIGGYGLYKQIKSLRLDKSRQTFSPAYTPQMKYDNTKRKLEQEIQSLCDSIENSELYSRNSLLMNLDPYHVFESTADIYIKTDYEIQPDKVYQSPDYTGSVVSSYKLLILEDDVLEEISDKYNIDPLYLQELIDVTEEISTKMIHLKVIHSEREVCESILSYLLERIQSKKPEIENQIGPHSLNIIQQSSRETIRKDIANMQKQQITSFQEYQASLTEKENDLMNLENPLLNKSGIRNSLIKHTVMGGILGCLISCFILGIRFINEDKLVSEDDLKSLYEFKILALIENVPSPYSLSSSPIFTQLGSYLDQRLNRLFHQKPILSKEVIYEMIASDLLKSEKQSEIQEKGLMLLGFAESEIKGKIARDLNDHIQYKGLNICIGNGFDAETVKNLADCSYVLLIEQYNRSTLTGISQELKVIENMGKMLLGCIISS